MERCSTGKRILANKSLAEEELIRVRVKYGDGPNQPNGIYQCEQCGAFHLTSKSRDTSFINSTVVKERIRRGRQGSDYEL